MHFTNSFRSLFLLFVLVYFSAACIAETTKVSASEFGDKWSFTVPDGELECINMAVLFHTSKGTYSLNGKAMGRYKDNYPAWREIAKPYPGLENNPSAKMPPPHDLIVRGLSLCN